MTCTIGEWRIEIPYTPCRDTAISTRCGISLSSTPSPPHPLLRLRQCYPILRNSFLWQQQQQQQKFSSKNYPKLPLYKFRMINGTLRFVTTKYKHTHLVITQLNNILEWNNWLNNLLIFKTKSNLTWRYMTYDIYATWIFKTVTYLLLTVYASFKNLLNMYCSTSLELFRYIINFRYGDMLLASEGETLNRILFQRDFA